MARVIAVSSPKGGVGKTACALLTGVALAERGLRVVAVDADHDVGTLPLLVPAASRAAQGARQALAARPDATPEALAPYLSRAPFGLDVLGGPFGPADEPRRTVANLATLAGLLEHVYDTVVLDLGTGLAHPLIRFALERADHVLMVTGPELIGASRVEAALRRLLDPHRGRLDPERVTIVLNRVRAPELAAAQLERFRRTGVRHDVAIPDDEHLGEMLDAGTFAIDSLRPATRMAVGELGVAGARAPATPAS